MYCELEKIKNIFLSYSYFEVHQYNYYKRTYKTKYLTELLPQCLVSNQQ